MGVAVYLAAPQHPERAGDDAVAAAVTDIGLDVDIPELVMEDGAGRAGFLAGRFLAVLADVAHHQPAAPVPAAVWGDLLDEGDVPPGRLREVTRVVVAMAREAQPIGGQLVPLLTGDLAGFAADAERGVGKEAHRRPLAVPVALDDGDLFGPDQPEGGA